ncbi:uncharacterized protein LOC129656502 [Bubalus kerabau]|uniref:uncharacterized protein LOC129656502 n=1 Tax=Bubalus carabanensis TaxID=3119969 RepID=UPI00244ECF96|nr:uncharacterized protein LOC129656502 [Bubalus carabanensis]
MAGKVHGNWKSYSLKIPSQVNKDNSSWSLSLTSGSSGYPRLPVVPDKAGPAARPRRGRGPGPGGGAWDCQSRARRCRRGYLHAVAGWLPALQTAVRRLSIPNRLPPCRAGAQAVDPACASDPGFSNTRSAQSCGMNLAGHARPGLRLQQVRPYLACVCSGIFAQRRASASVELFPPGYLSRHLSEKKMRTTFPLPGAYLCVSVNKP